MIELLRTALAGGSVFVLPLAFIGGVLAGVNPCCIPLYPAAAATCCAARGEHFGLTLGRAFAFASGMAFSTSLLGVLAAVAGRTMVGVGGWFQYVVALVPLAIGARALGWIRLPRFRTGRVARIARTSGAFVAGLLLSLVLAPCATPVLASVLGYAATRGNAGYGGVLLFAYGVGASLPILLAGSTIAAVAAKLDASRWRPWVDRATGATAIGVGLYLLWTARSV